LPEDTNTYKTVGKEEFCVWWSCFDIWSQDYRLPISLVHEMC
jgi:hypothetical protein